MATIDVLGQQDGYSIYYIRRLSVYSDSRKPVSAWATNSVFHSLKALRKVGGRVNPNDKIAQKQYELAPSVTLHYFISLRV